MAPFLFLNFQNYVLRMSIDLMNKTVSLKKTRSKRFPAETDVDYEDEIALFKNSPAQAECLL